MKTKNTTIQNIQHFAIHINTPIQLFFRCKNHELNEKLANRYGACIISEMLTKGRNILHKPTTTVEPCLGHRQQHVQ